MTKFSPHTRRPSSPSPSPKVTKRQHTWPGGSIPRYSSSNPESMRRFASETPVFASARITNGVGNSNNRYVYPAPPLLQSNNNGNDDNSSKPRTSESSVQARIFESSIAVGNDDDEGRRVVRQWTVKNLKAVPTHYPLDANAITLDGSIPLNVICSRICNFLRVNSMSATYRPHRVDCATMMGATMVKFSILLWKTPEGKKNGHRGGSIILEIVRRQGCSIFMQRIRHGIVQAIVSASGDEAPVVACERNTHTVDISALLDAETSCHQQQHYKSECFDALKCTSRLLKSSQYDQKRLGMESLVALTSVSIVSANDARLVCKALVYGNPPLGDCLRDAVLPFFENTRRGSLSSDDVEYDSDSDEDEDEYLNGSFFGTMHNLVLRVLANALQVIADLPGNDKSTDLSLIDLASPFWGHICDALVYNIEVVTHRPREAALSAQCLNLLAQVAPIICDCPIIDRLVPVLPEANEYGKECNLLLERESLKLMGTLSHAS